MGKTYRRTNPNTLPFAKGASERPWDTGVDYKLVDKLPRGHGKEGSKYGSSGVHVRANPKVVARQRQSVLDENRAAFVLKVWKYHQLFRGATGSADVEERLPRILQTWAAAAQDDEEEEEHGDCDDSTKWHGLADLADLDADGFAEVAATAAASRPSLVSLSA